MEQKFDPETIKAQILNLTAERDRIENALQSLEAALLAMAGSQSVEQPKFGFKADIPLHEAVRQTCLKLVDAITRQRVTRAIERAYPMMKPNPSTVGASLLNLSRGQDAILIIAIEGRGSAPSVYSTEGDVKIRLNSEEIEALMDERSTRGTGGWQSLWSALQKNFDKATGEINLPPKLRARIHRYYHEYGVGGWQTLTKRVFKRELPHLFLP